MTGKENHRVVALKAASQAKRALTLARATEALQVMERDNVPINFESVAKMAGVSKTWLYQQLELSKRIKRHRDKTDIIKRNSDTTKLLKRRDQEIVDLKTKLQKKNADIKNLKLQLEKVYGKLYNKDQENG